VKRETLCGKLLSLFQLLIENDACVMLQLDISNGYKRMTLIIEYPVIKKKKKDIDGGNGQTYILEREKQRRNYPLQTALHLIQNLVHPHFPHHSPSADKNEKSLTLSSINC